MVNKKRGVFLGMLSYLNFPCSSFNFSLLNATKHLRANGYVVDGAAVTACPYIQAGRNAVVYEFLQTDCDTLIFLDDDMSWKPEDIVRLIETPGRVVAGAYRKKKDMVEYAVRIKTKDTIPLIRPDGCIAAHGVATGFLKIDRYVFTKLQQQYPELRYGLMFDYFPQGVQHHVWVGEDYAFCNLWTKTGGNIWVLPDIDFTHHGPDKDYHGNYHEFLKSLPGGIDSGDSK